MPEDFEGSAGALADRDSPVEYESFADHCDIDLNDCDPFTRKSLVAAMFESALHEADLLAEWAGGLQAETIVLLYVTAIEFIEKRRDLTGFVGCPVGTELLDWLGVEPQSYWKSLRERLEKSRKGIRAARRIILRGPQQNL